VRPRTAHARSRLWPRLCFSPQRIVGKRLSASQTWARTTMTKHAASEELQHGEHVLVLDEKDRRSNSQHGSRREGKKRFKQCNDHRDQHSAADAIINAGSARRRHPRRPHLGRVGTARRRRSSRMQQAPFLGFISKPHCSCMAAKQHVEYRHIHWKPDANTKNGVVQLTTAGAADSAHWKYFRGNAPVQKRPPDLRTRVIGAFSSRSASGRAQWTRGS
jgi:hypothetical protein